MKSIHGKHLKHLINNRQLSREMPSTNLEKIYTSPYRSLISNNFSMTFFCATRILRVIGRQSIRQSTDFLA